MNSETMEVQRDSPLRYEPPSCETAPSSPVLSPVLKNDEQLELDIPLDLTGNEKTSGEDKNTMKRVLKPTEERQKAFEEAIERAIKNETSRAEGESGPGSVSRDITIVDEMNPLVKGKIFLDERTSPEPWFGSSISKRDIKMGIREKHKKLDNDAKFHREDRVRDGKKREEGAPNLEDMRSQASEEKPVVYKESEGEASTVRKRVPLKDIPPRTLPGKPEPKEQYMNPSNNSFQKIPPSNVATQRHQLTAVIFPTV